MFKSKIQNPNVKINRNSQFQIPKHQLSQLSFVIWISSIILMSGCATVAEGTKGLLGVSTKALEEGRDKAIKVVFDHDYDTCYTQVKNMLKKRKSYIYAENPAKNMIAIYISEEDTTPVGLFFSSIDANRTQIEVSSPSTYGRELIAKRISIMFEKPLKAGGESDDEE